MSGTACMQAILELVDSMRDLQQQAVHQYQLVVDEILRSRSRDAQRIEHALDRMLGFCGHEDMLRIYKSLCRHYWGIDPAAAAYYANAYREYWDGGEQGVSS